MPWTKKQQRIAQAVEHGWKAKGSAKGFDKGFAEQVIAESDSEKARKKAAETRLGKGAKPAPKR